MIISDGNNHVVIADPAATAVIATQTAATVTATPAAKVVIAAGIQGPEGVSGGTGSATNTLQLEMGETLQKGAPVCVINNKFYLADNVVNFNVVGLLSADAAITNLGRAEISGQIVLNGLTPGAPYFLGDGVITSTAPTAGFVIRVGQAITSALFVVRIEEPILLN